MRPLVPLSEMYMARAFMKLAQLPEPPPESGESPQPEGTFKEHAQPEVKRPILHALKATMGPALAFGGGTAAGYLAQRGVEKAFNLGKSSTGTLTRHIVPVAGGMMGLALQQYKSREHQELQRALEAHRRKSQGSVPTQ
jgi:hypothetical protein